MKLYTFIFKIIIPFLFINSVFAQRGPGGVSAEGAGDSNCKVWCDATSITAADGAFISFWQDESLSAVNNSPNQPNGVQVQPIVRKDASAGINGHPIIQFGDGRRLLFNDSPEINTGAGPYTQKTTFMVFRTGEDVNSRQMIYEEGGTVRGLNVYILNGQLYVGGYDNANDADGTPRWTLTPPAANRYTFTRTNIQPSTTYVICHMFNGPVGAPIAGNGGFIRGFINGNVFVSGDAPNVGSLWNHPDNPGLGAVNGGTYFATGSYSGDGDSPFLGDYSEFILYSQVLNDAERIIVENYLGAKYFANLITNDYYEYKISHGNDVIGIGQENIGETHNNSRGRNIFEMRANLAAYNIANEFLLCGHNNGKLDSYTGSNAPSVSTQILKREWRFDHTGDLGDITFQLDASQVPAFPDGTFTKYVLVVDKSAGFVSDYNSSQTEVIEMVNVGGNLYEATSDIPDGSFVTFGVIRPTVYFENINAYSFETETNQAENISVLLNYKPAANTQIDFGVAILVDANTPNDYIVTSTTPVIFNAGDNTETIDFTIVGDAIAENTESFTITLTDLGNTTAGLNIATENILTYTIYDNDNIPKISFQTNTSTQNEDVVPQTRTLTVIRSGSLAGAASVDYRLNTTGVVPTAGTATEGTDYQNFTNGTLNFANGESVKTFTFTITDDLINETDETILFELYNVVNADLISGSEIHTTTIVNDDNVPQVSFTLATSGNPEVIGEPEIQIQLSTVSALDITVRYNITGGTTATQGVDFNLADPGEITILAGETTTTIPLIITNDIIPNEPDEFVEITLATAVNASINPANDVHTYRIGDYNSFEWKGSGGVGHADDNIMWLVADSVTVTTHNSRVQDFIDISPNNNNSTQTTNGEQPRIQITANTINNHQVLRFDGTDDEFILASGSEINTASYTDKTIFVVFRTGNNVNNRQLIYEQGGGTNGINLYIDGNDLHGHIWCLSNGWGGTWGNAKVVETTGNTLAPNTTYFATLVYDYNSPTDNRFELFLNGSSVDIINDNSIGILSSHGNAGCIGGLESSTLFPDGGTTGNFGGDIAEFIYYNDDEIDVNRRIIVENYLAAKYDVNFTNIADKLYNYETTHSHEVVGIGTSGNYHLDSQGAGRVRIRNPLDADANEHLFIGHDNASFTQNTINVPDGIEYRLNRVWRASEPNGDIGTITLTFDAIGFLNQNGDDVELLIDADGDFSTGAVQHTMGRSYDAINEIITFTGVSLSDGDYFTIGCRPLRWTGNLNTNWNSTYNWNGSIPTRFNNVIIPQNPEGGNFPETNTGLDGEVRNITIEAGARVTIPNGKSVHVFGDFLMQSNEDSTASFIDNGTLIVDGTTTVERWLYGCCAYNYHYISSPLNGADANVFPQELYYYDESHGSYYLNYGWNAAAGNLNVMQGYNANITTSASVQFTGGSLNTGTLNYNHTYTATSATQEYEGWNLVGNPYPSTLDWDLVDAVTANIENEVHYWNGAFYSDYVDGVGTNNGSRYIPPMQGFFIKSKVGGGTLTFDNTMRNHRFEGFWKSRTYNNLLRLKVSDKINSDETVIRLNVEALTDRDAKDALKFFVDDSTFIQIYSSSDDNIPLSINSYPKLEEKISIPIGINSNFAENIELTASQIFFEKKYDLILEDLVEKLTINLREKSNYVFETLGMNNAKRFLLHIIPSKSPEEEPSPEEPNEDNKDIHIYFSKEKIHYKLPKTDNVNGSILVTNTLGQIIIHQKVYSDTGSFEIKNFTGILIVKLWYDKKLTTKKILAR